MLDCVVSRQGKLQRVEDGQQVFISHGAPLCLTTSCPRPGVHDLVNSNVVPVIHGVWPSRSFSKPWPHELQPSSGKHQSLLQQHFNMICDVTKQQSHSQQYSVSVMFSLTAPLLVRLHVVQNAQCPHPDADPHSGTNT